MVWRLTWEIFLTVTVMLLFFYIYRLKRAMEEIGRDFAAHLGQETNTLITVSCQDRSVRRLAASLNRELTVLRNLRHRYEQGDREFREAVMNVSHDLRTPLTAICGYLDLLRKEPWITGESEGQAAVPSDSVRRASRYLERILERTMAMRRLTGELFQYFMIAGREAGDRPGSTQQEREEVSLNAALEESLAGFYAAFMEKGIVPQVKLSEIPVRRWLNRNALSRIFDNILNNALKYSDGDLQVILTTEGEILFSNHAASMNPVLAGRLFDRFFTVEGKTESSGLGLSIARILTERMGGEIGAWYEDGKLVIRLRLE